MTARPIIVAIFLSLIVLGEPVCLAAAASKPAKPDPYAPVKQFLQNLENQYNARSNEDLLCMSAASGNLDAVKFLLTKGVSLNGKNPDGDTALMSAVRARQEDAVKYLLNQPKVDVNIRCNGVSPLLDAALTETGYQGGNTAVWLPGLKLLLQHPDIDVNCRDASGRTPLIRLAQHSYDGEAVKLLLQNPELNISAVDNRGNNAYIYAMGQFENPYDRGPGINRHVVQALEVGRATWPAFPDVDRGASSGLDPIVLTEADVLYYGEKKNRMDFVPLAINLSSRLMEIARRREPHLLVGIERIDRREQLNEPEIEKRNWEKFQKGFVLLLNRLIGTEKRAESLYTIEGWMDVKLPPHVTGLIREIREMESTSPTPAGLTRTTRLLNALLIDQEIGKSLSPRFHESIRKAVPPSDAVGSNQ